jgi:hypothetical protein
MLVRSFNTLRLSVCGSMIQPVHCFLNLCQGKRVFPAGKRPGLKRTQAVNNNGEQVFLMTPIDTMLFDRSVLETNLCKRQSPLVIVGRMVVSHLVRVARSTLSGFVKHQNSGESFCSNVQFSHFANPFV